jgi:predicted SnoaL-like aldol condensation-catalyzing enzyme
MFSMSSEKNKANIRKVNEALNKKDLTAIDEFMAPDYVDHTNQLRGREDVKQFYTRAFKDLPDFHRTVEDIIAEGDKVWVRFKITGTAPSGKKIELTTVSILRIANGKATEGWTVPKVTGQDRSIDRSLYEKT